MQFIAQLWIPILVCAVALFICSFLVWAILPHHRNDWSKLPDEDGFRNHIKSINVPPGVYMFPKLDGKECKTPEGQAKWKSGPSGELRIWPGETSMGKNMALTFCVFLVASLLTAYVGWHVMGRDPVHYASFEDRFQVVGTIGILTYCFSSLPNMIWFKAGKRAIVNGIADGLLYGIVTGAVYSWLWPVAAPALPH